MSVFGPRMGMLNSPTHKVAISRYITVSVLGCTEAPSALFSRSSYHIIAIRDHIMQRIQSLPTSAGIHEIGAAIKSKEADIVNILKHSLPSDIILFLDTFLQLLIVSDEKTILFRGGWYLACNVLMGLREAPKHPLPRLPLVVVLTLSHVGQFLHQAMASTTTSSNSHTPSFMNGGTTSPFQRLINTKELGYVFLHLQSIPTNGKVFGVAKIIMSFFENALPISGYEISENERVGGLLAIKVSVVCTCLSVRTFNSLIQYTQSQ